MESKHLKRSPRRRDPRAAIEGRIQEALEDNGHRAHVSASQLSSPDPERSDRQARTLRLMEDRADLVAFGLTSTLKGVGRASTTVRGALRRALLEVLHRQTEHNRASDELIRSHEAQLEALRATVRAQLEIQSAADERLGELEGRLTRVERKASGAPLPDLDELAFADRFRGTRVEVRERQRRYLARFQGASDVVDLGCGRGEFLELLNEAGVRAVGVDRDEAMVARCRELGLNVSHDDALGYLREASDGSCGGIFAGRLVEHLAAAEIAELLELGIRRMRSGGGLVIETLNPMSPTVQATFFEDLTRVRPVPPGALEWLAESWGFAEVAIEFSAPGPPADCQHYALVAHKPS